MQLEQLQPPGRWRKRPKTDLCGKSHKASRRRHIAQCGAGNRRAVPMHARAGSSIPYILKASQFFLSYRCEYRMRKIQTKRVHHKVDIYSVLLSYSILCILKSQNNKPTWSVSFIRGYYFKCRTSYCRSASKLGKYDGKKCVFLKSFFFAARRPFPFEAVRLPIGWNQTNLDWLPQIFGNWVSVIISSVKQGNSYIIWRAWEAIFINLHKFELLHSFVVLNFVI